MTVLETRSLGVRYATADNPILWDVSLSLAEGERLGIVGFNGSGKSTLAQTIIGIIPEFFSATVSGEVYLKGQRVDSLPIAERLGLAGYSFQDVDSQILFGSVEEILGLREDGTKRDLIELAVELLGLRPLLHRLPSELSGGEAQRLALCAALRRGPNLILYDEAVAALDPLVRERFGQLVTLLSRRGHAVVIMGQRVELLAPYVDGLVEISDGRMKQQPLSTTGKSVDTAAASHQWLQMRVWLQQHAARANGTAVEVEVVDLTLQRRAHGFALGPLHLQISPGEVVALVGPNGSGKSTIIDLILGMLRPDAGRILFRSKNGTVITDRRRIRMGALFQNPSNQFINSSVGEELLGNLTDHQDRSFEELVSLISSVFPFLQPERDPLDLSYGQQKILGLVGTILAAQNVVVLDEPEQGLDPSNYSFLVDWLTWIRQTRATTILFTTHDLKLAATCADRIILLHHGNVVHEYTHVTETDLFNGFLCLS